MKRIILFIVYNGIEYKQIGFMICDTMRYLKGRRRGAIIFLLTEKIDSL